jgi:hypothetical protein
MLRIVVALLLGLLVLPAFAGYAQLAPPPGFSSVGGVSTMPVGAAANGARYAGGYVVGNASLNIGARAVTVPVAMRVAANAASFAVTRMNPWIAGLSLVASAIPYIVDWFTGSDLEVGPDGKMRVRGEPGEPIPAGEGDYWVSVGGVTVSMKSWGTSRCENAGGLRGIIAASCGTYSGKAAMCNNFNVFGCFAEAPAPTTEGTPARPPTYGDLADLANSPINPALFPELGIPIPVDPVPVVNPATQPVGDVVISPSGNPAPQLQPQPLRIPNGDPVPIPNTNPQSYSQPWLEVHPSPTADDPWRVDVRPVVTETTNPNPLPDPTTPVPPTEFYTDCEKFPASIGCMPVGEPPTGEAIPRETRTLELQNGPTFGGAGCPANLTFTLHGQTYTGINMAEPCAWVSNLVRPVVLLLAFISAVGIVRSALKG